MGLRSTNAIALTERWLKNRGDPLCRGRIDCWAEMLVINKYERDES
jgi:hypothetical protein